MLRSPWGDGLAAPRRKGSTAAESLPLQTQMSLAPVTAHSLPCWGSAAIPMGCWKSSPHREQGSALVVGTGAADADNRLGVPSTTLASVSSMSAFCCSLCFHACGPIPNSLCSHRVLMCIPAEPDLCSPSAWLSTTMAVPVPTQLRERGDRQGMVSHQGVSVQPMLASGPFPRLVTLFSPSRGDPCPGRGL